jgi:hypothetical protein
MNLVNGHKSVLREEWIYSVFFKIIFEEVSSCPQIVLDIPLNCIILMNLFLIVTYVF